MRDPVNNPFTPGSDTIPQVWAGRTEQLNDWRDIVRPRLLAGLPERGRIFLGEPGLGKSALARHIAQDAVAAGDWTTTQLRIPSGADPLKLLASGVLKLADDAGLSSSSARRTADLFDRVESVATHGFALSLHQKEGPEPFKALTDLLVEVGRAAITHRTVAMIHLDEIQNVTNADVLSQLLIALGDAITHEITVTAPGNVRVNRTLPIAVYLTGLPDFDDMTGARKGATFARRFQTTTLAPIDDEDLRAALQPFILDGWEIPDPQGGVQRIYMEPAAASMIVDLCCGEPFLFQLAGEQAWYAGTEQLITREHVRTGWRKAQREARSHVERLLDRLPGRESDFIRAMAELPAPERTLTRIATEIGCARASDAGPFAQRLDTVRGIITRGRPYTFRHRAVEAYLTSDWPDVN